MKCNQAFGHRGVIVTTKHSYVIDYKYVWECTNCGAKFKRHSKSIDPTRHRCGSCKSKLVQIKPIRRNVSPSEYQRFLKRHLKEMKRDHPLSTHKDIMGLIGAAYKKEKAVKVAAAAAKSEGDLDSIIETLNRLDVRDREDSIDMLSDSSSDSDFGSDSDSDSDSGSGSDGPVR
jgi:tRNA G26 N,N-dimethylase Trm1